VNTVAALRLGVAICAVGAAAVLVLQALRTRAFGTRPPFAPAAGSAWRGVLYAFGPGMAPTAKESTRTHPVVWALGVSYHLGVFTSLAVLLWTLLAAGGAAAALPPPAMRAAGLALAALGVIGGVSLLVRRAREAALRAISVRDDWLANTLTTGFVALAGARLLTPAAEPLLLAWAMLLILYAPLGKIRHCLFFFVSRYHLGRHYGRRGTFPPRH
jgi:nitrate reductase gamma subunit